MAFSSVQLTLVFCVFVYNERFYRRLRKDCFRTPVSVQISLFLQKLTLKQKLAVQRQKFSDEIHRKFYVTFLHLY